MEWLRLTQAGIRCAKSYNVVYRLAAIGRIRTRQDELGRLEFCVEDLDRIAKGTSAERGKVARKNAPVASTA